MLEGGRIFTVVSSPVGLPNFCHNFWPALSEKRIFLKDRVMSNFSCQLFNGGHNNSSTLNYVHKANLF